MDYFSSLSWFANQICWKCTSILSLKCFTIPCLFLFTNLSGILLCAKTKLARTQFAAYFADGTSSVIRNRFRNIPLVHFSPCLCMQILYIQRMISLFVFPISWEPFVSCHLLVAFLVHNLLDGKNNFYHCGNCENLLCCSSTYSFIRMIPSVT